MSRALGRYIVREGEAGASFAPIVAVGYMHRDQAGPRVGDVLDPAQVGGRRLKVVEVKRQSSPPVLLVEQAP